MGQDRSRSTLAAPLPAKQARSRRTRDALIAAGWELLGRQRWDDITIGNIVEAAGSSVGSFYSRFADRDAFFETMAAEWIERRARTRAERFALIGPDSDFAATAILDTYRMTMQHQHFWRAALVKGASQTEFWTPFRALGIAAINRVIELRGQALGRALTEEEVRRIRFAFQMANGLINNSIVNRPGPIMPGTPEFETELVRGLKAVAGFL